MSEVDAARFLAASHDRLTYVRRAGEIAVDGKRWIVGFVQGAPFRKSGLHTAQRS
jgi:hypothetical protein